MAETLTGASRAAVQRNLAWMEAHGLIREVTGQGRFRMWPTMSQVLSRAAIHDQAITAGAISSQSHHQEQY